MKNRRPRVALLLSVFIAVCLTACAAKERRLTRVMVTGESDVKAQPDTAVLAFSVVTQSQRALDAQQQNARKSAAVIQVVKETTGANTDVKTSDYSLQPQRDYNGSMPRIVGYEARNSVTVMTGNLDNVGALIDAATGAGANAVENVSFILRENNPARSETLSEATRQAMSKAQSIAQALGGRVVRVVEEQEGGFVNRPTATDEERMSNYAGSTSTNMNASAKAAPRTPVEAGALNVRAQVQLIVEIEARP